jgi:hypothetical protein
MLEAALHPSEGIKRARAGKEMGVDRMGWGGVEVRTGMGRMVQREAAGMLKLE